MTKRGIDDLPSFNGTSPSSGAVVSALAVPNINGTGTAIECMVNGLNGGAATAVSNGTTTTEQLLLNGYSTDPTLTGLPAATVLLENVSVKKMKLEHENGHLVVTGAAANGLASSKSRVIHIRNIPPDTNANDLMVLAMPFGTVTKHLMVRSKGQAFIEFESHFSAIQMANYWIQTTIGGIPTTLQPTIRGRHVHCQISNHKELKTTFDNNNEHNNNGHHAGNNQHHSHHQQHHNNNNNNNGDNDSGSTDSGATLPTSNGSDAISATPSPVIRVAVENQLYPITLDVLHTIFSRAGKVCKIVTFTKNNCFQALIQFGDLASSIQAKLMMDNQNMYQAANTLRIDYSKLQQLTVKYNNEKSRDYSILGVGNSITTANTGPVPISQMQIVNGNSAAVTTAAAMFSSLNGAFGGGATGGTSTATSSMNGTQSEQDQLNTLLAAAASANNSAAASHHHHQQQQQQQQQHAAALSFAAASQFANSHAATVGSNPFGSLNGQCLPTHPHPSQFAGSSVGAAAAARYNIQHVLNNALAAGGAGLINHSNAIQFAANAAAAAAATGVGVTGLVLTPVIHVSGLSAEHTTPDALFTLFGVYGDVLRVKILFNKKDTALIQMAEPSQANLAISYLDRIRFHGRTLRVMSSKHQIVQMPKEGHQDSGLTKDFTNSSLHRFKRPGSKNYNNIYPPSETLHVSNIPPTVTEDELKASFVTETGRSIAKFKFFPNDHRMALVQFDATEDAILALIKMHNFKVAEHSHLRVSFSKSPV